MIKYNSGETIEGNAHLLFKEVRGAVLVPQVSVLTPPSIMKNNSQAFVCLAFSPLPAHCPGEKAQL